MNELWSLWGVAIASMRCVELQPYLHRSACTSVSPRNGGARLQGPRVSVDGG